MGGTILCARVPDWVKRREWRSLSFLMADTRWPAASNCHPGLPCCDELYLLKLLAKITSSSFELPFVGYFITAERKLTNTEVT